MEQCRKSGPAFYYDLGSPYAWLTAERIRGATWIPVLLGGIFHATGRSSWARTGRRAAGIAEIERRRPLSDPANVALAAERAGLDGDAVLAATRDQAVEDRLRANTDAALAAGVIGVPTVITASGGILFGDDVIADDPAGGEAAGGQAASGEAGGGEAAGGSVATGARGRSPSP